MSKIKGQRIIELNQADSTNTYAAKLLESGKVGDGTVVWARAQTAGKGLGDNKWLSQPGSNITISITRFPTFLPAENQFMLNKSVSLAVLDFVHSLLPAGSCKIKWPNDIYYTLSKLGGILINHTVSGNMLDSSIIGIGININQTQFDPSLPNPVSVKQILFEENEIHHVLMTLIKKLDNRYDQLKKGEFLLLDHEYRENLLGINEERNFMTKNKVFNGSVRDVDLFGRLIIETADNKRLTFAHREVEMVL